jgi:hypothetical protein
VSRQLCASVLVSWKWLLPLNGSFSGEKKAEGLVICFVFPPAENPRFSVVVVSFRWRRAGHWRCLGCWLGHAAPSLLLRMGPQTSTTPPSAALEHCTEYLSRSSVSRNGECLPTLALRACVFGSETKPVTVDQHTAKQPRTKTPDTAWEVLDRIRFAHDSGGRTFKHPSTPALDQQRPGRTDSVGTTPAGSCGFTNDAWPIPTRINK